MLLKKDKKIFQTNIGNIFAKRDLYTLNKDTEDASTIIEDKFYGQLDSNLSVVTNRMVNNVRNGQAPKFENVHAKVAFLDAACRSQLMRGPNSLSASLGDLNVDAIIEEVAENRRKQGLFNQTERDELGIPRFRDELIRESEIRARISQTSNELLDAFADSLVEFCITLPADSFLLSDYLCDGRPGYPAKNNTMYFPLSPKVAVRPIFWAGKILSSNIVPISRDSLRGINERLFQQSDIVAATSDQQLLSLAKRFNLKKVTKS